LSCGVRILFRELLLFDENTFRAANKKLTSRKLHEQSQSVPLLLKFFSPNSLKTMRSVFIALWHERMEIKSAGLLEYHHLPRDYLMVKNIMESTARHA
jgi:hypothetical protein